MTTPQRPDQPGRHLRDPEMDLSQPVTRYRDPSSAPPLRDPAEDRWTEVSTAPPEDTPEVVALVLMVAGAVDGVTRAVKELEHNLGHVLQPAPPPGDVIPHPDASTELGRRLVQVYADVSSLEGWVHTIRQRLGV